MNTTSGWRIAMRANSSLSACVACWRRRAPGTRQPPRRLAMRTTSTRVSTGKSWQSAWMSLRQQLGRLLARQPSEVAAERVDQAVERLERHGLVLVAAAAQRHRAADLARCTKLLDSAVLPMPVMPCRNTTTGAPSSVAANARSSSASSLERPMNGARASGVRAGGWPLGAVGSKSATRVAGAPDEAMHYFGKLLRHVGEDRILLCRRAIEPRRGYWTLPAGFLELGESAMAGAIRETREEAQAEVRILAPYAHFDVPHIGQAYILYRAALQNERFSPGSESLEVELVPPDRIPWDQLAFPVVRHALELVVSDLALGRFRTHQAELVREQGRYELREHLALWLEAE